MDQAANVSTQKRHACKAIYFAASSSFLQESFGRLLFSLAYTSHRLTRAIQPFQLVLPIAFLRGSCIDGAVALSPLIMLAMRHSVPLVYLNIQSVVIKTLRQSLLEQRSAVDCYIVAPRYDQNCFARYLFTIVQVFVQIICVQDFQGKQSTLISKSPVGATLLETTDVHIGGESDARRERRFADTGSGIQA